MGPVPLDTTIAPSIPVRGPSRPWFELAVEVPRHDGGPQADANNHPVHRGPAENVEEEGDPKHGWRHHDQVDDEPPKRLTRATWWINRERFP